MPRLETPSHGKGQLYRGGVPGHRGGSGRPPALVREKLAQIVEANGVDLVGQVVRGELEEATVKDRLHAVDLAARIGLGGRVDASWIRGRIALTLDVLEAQLPPELLETVLPQLEDVWGS